ncbi:hypothetical protein DVH24_001839 [Malus domestica]|uniref:Uncharacterized protein n=1 Tax=Malus domestica TaxID=3750 RepID=A0A498I9U7_MALDO|nr:hypothetical protein DVH24_001839 [Malus domestica]
MFGFCVAVKSLIQNPKKSRTFLTATASSSSISVALHYSPISYPFSHPFVRLSSQISKTFLSPLSNWISSTPLYIDRNVVILKKIEASLNLNLLRRRPSFLLPMEVGSLSPAPTVVDCRVMLKEGADDFVNLPNLISMSRLTSGPFLGW